VQEECEVLEAQEGHKVAAEHKLQHEMHVLQEERNKVMEEDKVQKGVQEARNVQEKHSDLSPVISY
jgi:hypothetical protein